MPYDAKLTQACPISKPWGVMNSTTAQIMGCHASKDDAQQQINALYASEQIERAKYDGIDFTPPQGARDEAEKGLKWRKQFSRGGTPVGWARARDIANGVKLSPETITRMVAFFSRHQGNEQAEGWSPGEKGFPSNGRIAWALWGGDPGRTWSRKIKNQMDARDKAERMNKPTNIARSIGNPKDGRVVIATETPIEIYDQERNQIVRQILLMDGVQFRNDKKQLPIVDTHNDRTVRNVFGSIRNIVIESDQLIGEPVFASDPESQIVRTRFDEGHLNDFSIDATILARVFVQDGQQYTTSRGVKIEGPAEIVTAWEPHNASICATGADPNSTVRRSKDQEITRSDMSPELMDRLMKMGLPEGMTDLEQITMWVLDHMEKPIEVEVEVPPDPEADPAAASRADTGKMTADEIKPVVAQEVARALQAEQSRRKAIVSVVNLAKLERSVADSMIDEGISVEVARKRVMAMSANEPVGTSFSSVGNTRETGIERFHNAMRDAIILRSLKSARISRQDLIPNNPDAEDFKHLGLNRMAELILRQHGINTDRMSPIDIARVAMGYQDACRKWRVQRDVYHTTGSFQNILLDSVNKTLLAGYEEAPATWSAWARQAPSVADFKTINRTRFSEAPDPEQVPERGEYKEKPMTDSKESYKIEKYGEIFSVSWETVVNDDLDAIARVPAMHGNAHRRKVNREVYAVLASNPTMGDTYSLFSASHASGSNLSGSNGNPTVANLNTAYAAMRTQKGLTSDAILNVVPRYLIVPAALEATADELVSSTSYIVANGNSGVQNLYGPGGKRNLVVVCDPNLDGNSTTAWYLAADPGQIDTIEVSFLQGEESPVLESEWNYRRDAYEYKTRQTFGIKAIDWRGLYKFATA